MIQFFLMFFAGLWLWRKLNKKTKEKLLKNLENLQSKLNNLEAQCQKLFPIIESIESSSSDTNKQKFNDELKNLIICFKNFKSSQKSVDYVWAGIRKEIQKMIDNQQNNELKIKGIKLFTYQSGRYQELEGNLQIAEVQTDELLSQLKSVEAYLAQKFYADDLSELKTLIYKLISIYDTTRQSIQDFRAFIDP